MAWVEKNGNVYTLTIEGKKFVANMDLLGNLKQTFKVSVVLYVVNGAKILAQKRLRHPFFGDITSVAGKVLPGEKIEAAASRKLKEETGLVGSFKLLGVHRKIRKTKQGEVIEDTFYNVCVCRRPEGELEEKNMFGENFWVEFGQMIEWEKKNADTGKTDIEIIERIRDNNDELFYFEEETVVERY